MSPSKYAVLGALLVWAGCSEAPTESTESAAVAGCTGAGFYVTQLVCDVGVTATGSPAVNFGGRWFSVNYDGMSWTVANNVSAQPAGVNPVDTFDDSRPGCEAGCPPECPPNPEMECDIRFHQDCIDMCNRYYTVDVTRRLTWTVNGVPHTIDAVQEVRDELVQGGTQTLHMFGEVSFTLNVNDPVDHNPWTLAIHPVRNKNNAADQNQVNWEVTEPGATTSVGQSGTLFSASQIDVQLQTDVELMAAVKTGGSGTPEFTATSNLALNRALDQVLPAGSSFQNHVEPQAMQVTGNVLSRIPGVATQSAYDLQRFSQFYMDNRRGQAGYSSTGSGERPFVENKPGDFRFRHTVLDYNVNFSFLAGICGLNVGVHSYVAGSFVSGRTACFDGVATSVDQHGNLEFDLKAMGDFGCNILVASASSGLGAGVKAAAEFQTSLETVPPHIAASFNVYSEVQYSAHFKVRVLFWSKKWERVVGPHRIFQKSASVNLEPVRTDPGGQLCPDGGPPSTGTCEDPSSKCDIEGRCVRYRFTSTGQPERADVDECLLPTCSVLPPDPTDFTLTPFASGPPTCRPQCTYAHGLDTNPDGTQCTSQCDGLPSGFNRALLAIPATATVQILTSSDGGQRARVYTWDAGGKKAVIEILGVNSGATLFDDLKNCATDWVAQVVSPTAAVVNAKLTELYSQGYARQNVLIRGHSLGSLDAYQVLEFGSGAGNGILLGVPLHAVIHLEVDLWYRNRNPFPNTQIGFFVSPTDPIARGVPVTNLFARWNETWCTTKRGRGPAYNQMLPQNIRFNVVDTPSESYISGHFISSYCAVAKVTCFQGDNLVRNTAVTLRFPAGGVYLNALGAGGGATEAKFTTEGAWAQYVVESIGPLHDGSQVYIRTADNVHFLQRDSLSIMLTAGADKRNQASSFTIVRLAGPGNVQSGDLIGLRNLVRGAYVSLFNNGSGNVGCHAAALGPQETLQIVFK